MEITKTIQSIPTNVLLFGVLTVALAIFLNISGNWTKEFQFLIGGMLAITVILGMKETKKEVDLEEAKQIALKWARQKKQTQVIKGTIRESIEGTTRERDGKPWYHECAVLVDNPSPTYYVISITKQGKIRKTTKRNSWSAKDAPDVEIVTPPDIFQWIRAQKALEEKVEESAK